MIKAILLVALGGAAGSVSRYLSGLFVNRYFQHTFPLATFAVNIIGCLLIGFLFGLIEKHQPANDNLRYLFITGFCGGFTTFSAFAAENLNFISNSNYTSAFMYITFSVIAGIAAIWIGLIISRHVL